MVKEKYLAVLVAAFAIGAAYPAFGQQSPSLASVAASCGTQSYTAGQNRPVVQDTAGKLCTGAVITPGGTQDVNLKQVGGVATDIGTGAAGTGTQRVSVSSDSTLTPIPAATAAAGIAQTQCSALCSNLVAKSGAGNLYTFNVAADSTLSGAAYWIMVFNATSAPGDGAVTPALCYAVPSGATNFSASFSNTPAYFSTGITIVASTNGCFTLAKSTHMFASAGAK